MNNRKILLKLIENKIIMIEESLYVKQSDLLNYNTFAKIELAQLKSIENEIKKSIKAGLDCCVIND